MTSERAKAVANESLGLLESLPTDDVRNVSQALAAGLHLECAKSGHQCPTCRARWATIRMVEATLQERGKP